MHRPDIDRTYIAERALWALSLKVMLLATAKERAYIGPSMYGVNLPSAPFCLPLLACQEYNKPRTRYEYKSRTRYEYNKSRTRYEYNKSRTRYEYNKWRTRYEYNKSRTRYEYNKSRTRYEYKPRTRYEYKKSRTRYEYNKSRTYTCGREGGN